MRPRKEPVKLPVSIYIILSATVVANVISTYIIIRYFVLA